MTILDRAEVIIGGDDKPLQRALGRAEGRMRSAGRTMQNMGRRMSTRVTLPLAAIGAASVTMSARFEESMSRIQGLVGVAGDQVNQWGQDILQMAPRLGRAPQELAEGLFFVTSAGFRGAAAMDVLEQSARGAAAGLGETATIADAVTSAVNAYGQENLSATQAVDTLTAAVREGKLEAQSLAPVLGNLLPIASAMNISFEQVAGMLAVFSRTGADAASGAVTLQRLMLTLQKNTGPAVDMLESAGLSLAKLRDVASGPGGLIGVMRLLNETFADDEEALALLFPNVRAFRGVMNALAQDADVVDGVMTGVADSTGSLDRAFEAASSTGAFQLKAALSQLQVVGVRVGSIMLPIVADAAARVTGILSRLSPQALRTGVQVAFLAAAIGPALLLLGGLIRIGALATAGLRLLAGAAVFSGSALAGVFTGAVRVATGAVAAMGATIRGVAALIGSLKTFGALALSVRSIGGAAALAKIALASVAGVISGPVVAAVAGAVGIVGILVGEWDKVGAVAGRVWRAILDFVPGAMRAIGRVVGSVINFIVGAFRFVGMAAEIVWDEFVKGPAVAAFEAIRKIAEPVLTAIASGLELVGKIASGAADKMRGFFTDAAEGGEEEGADLGSRFAQAAVTAFGADYVGGFLDVVKTGVARAKALVERALGMLSGGGAGGGGAPGASPELDKLLQDFEQLETDLDGVDTRSNTASGGMLSLRDSFTAVDQATMTLQRGLSGLFDDFMSDTVSAGEAMKNLAKVAIRELNRILAKIAALSIMKAIIPGAGMTAANFEALTGLPALAGLPGFADGGFLRGGGLGWVGERGPELIQAGPRGATITPMEQVAGGEGRSFIFDFSKIPASRDPLSMARDRLWQRFLRDSAIEAKGQGFRFEVDD